MRSFSAAQAPAPLHSPGSPRKMARTIRGTSALAAPPAAEPAPPDRSARSILTLQKFPPPKLPFARPASPATSVSRRRDSGWIRPAPSASPPPPWAKAPADSRSKQASRRESSARARLPRSAARARTLAALECNPVSALQSSVSSLRVISVNSVFLANSVKVLILYYSRTLKHPLHNPCERRAPPANLDSLSLIGGRRRTDCTLLIAFPLTSSIVLSPLSATP